MRAGEVLGEAWRLYTRHRRHLVSVAAVVYSGLGLLPLAVPLFLGPGGAPFVLFLFVAGFFWLLGALIQAVNDVRDGYADLTIRETLRRTARRVNGLAAAAVFALAAVAIGLALLVVPGLLLIAWWALVVPAIVLERAAAPRAFRRSRWLAAGSVRPLVGVVALAGVLLVVSWAGPLAAALVAIELWGDSLPALPRLPDWLWGYALGYVVLVAASSLTTPFVAAALTVAYFRLRDLRGPGPPVKVKLGVGDVLGEAWRLYVSHPRRLVPIAAALFALLALAELAVGFLGPDVAIFPVVLLVTTIGFLLLHSGVVIGWSQLGGGDPISVSDVLRRMRRPFLRVLAAWLLASVFVAVSLLFFVVPGLVLLTYWSLLTPVILLEGKGVFASFPRSARLVGGNGLRVFVVLLPTIFVWNYSLGAAELAPLPPFLYAAHVLANTLLMPYFAVAWTVAYFRLRDLPEVPAT